MPKPFKPEQFGRYLLTERIATGGMAEIFNAKVFGAMGFEKNLVIKRILPQFAEDTEFLRMFITEAKLVCHLEHPNIVQVHELGEIDGQYYIAMEYVNGIDGRHLWRTLAKRKQRLPGLLALFIVSEFLKGLDYAHRAVGPDGQLLGVVHRDVSPSNILISYRGDVKIGDFGIALVQQESKTQAGVLKGKFGYMSPEQVAGMKVDHRSDIFAGGIVLAELLLGRRLFLGQSDFETLDKVLNVKLDVLDEHENALPPEVVKIVRKALQREVGDRYQSAQEACDAIIEFLYERRARITNETLAAFIAEHVAPYLVKATTKEMSGVSSAPSASSGHRAPRVPSRLLPAVDASKPGPPIVARRAEEREFDSEAQLILAEDELGAGAPSAGPISAAPTAPGPPPQMAPQPQVAPYPYPPQQPMPAGYPATPGAPYPAQQPYAAPVPGQYPYPQGYPYPGTPYPPGGGPYAPGAMPSYPLAPAAPYPGATGPYPAVYPAPGAQPYPAPAMPYVQPGYPQQPPMQQPPMQQAPLTLDQPAPFTVEQLNLEEFQFGAIPVFEMEEGGELALDAVPEAPGEARMELEDPHAGGFIEGAGEELDLDQLGQPEEEQAIYLPAGPIVRSAEGASIFVSAQLSAAAKKEAEAEPDFAGQISARTVAKVLFRFSVVNEDGLLMLSGPTRAGRQAEIVEWLRALQARANAQRDAAPADGHTCSVHLAAGQPRLVAADRNDEALVAYLIRTEVLTSEKVERAILGNPHRKPVAALLTSGMLSPLGVSRHVTTFVLENVLQTFSWTDGEFAFYRGREQLSEAFPSGLDALAMIVKGVSTIEEPVLDAYFGPLAGHVVHVNRTPPMRLERFNPDAVLLEAYRALTSARTIDDALAACSRSGEAVAAKRALYLLLECELANVE